MKVQSPSLNRRETAWPAKMAAASSINLQNFRVIAYYTLALAKRGDREAQNRLMSAAVVFSLLLHCMVLAVRFVVADENRPAVSPPLSAALKNWPAMSTH